MSATSEYEPAARQDYGPTTSSESVYDHVLEHKLTDNMNVSSVRAPVLRAVPLSPTEGDPEPDSTNLESIIHTVQKKVGKEVEYHIAEKRCDTEMSVDSLSGIVRIEEASIDNVGHIAYPIIQETEDDSNDGTYIENSTTLIQAPLNTAIVQNVTKLPQNFTINVDAAVGNITAIQNVSQDVSGNQTLWLPAVLTTSATTTDNKSEEDQAQGGVSQIIITSESYVNDTNPAARRSNIVTETSYRPKASKVQILSNISLPKASTYSQQYISQNKEIAPVYGTQSHFYKWSTNVVSQKHVNNSVLCNKPPKSQSLIGCSMSPNVISNSPIKNVSYSHTFTKSTNLNKTLNKVNNGANLNALVAASSGNTQCHILSRVVSGPNKMSVHSGRKSVNSLKGAKNSGQVSGQKNQSRAIKIIQQTGSAHKSETKTGASSNNSSKSQTASQQTTYSGADTNNSKIIQKVGSPTHKPAIQQMSVQNFPSKGERLVLQSPCGPVLISTAPISTSLPKGPHYVQSGSTPNLRYVQTYGPADTQLSTISQVSANQQLTAQILQSLSQPKLMLQQAPAPITSLTPTINIEDIVAIKPNNQKRIVFGDKSTLQTADDIIGMEERPNLSEELRRYSFQALAFIMLDHTYALPAQKQPSPTTPTTTAVSTGPPTPVSPIQQITSPVSPLKRTSPVIMSTASYEIPITAPTIVPSPIPATTIQMGALTYKPQPLPTQPPDDDTASVISSIDGDRGAPANRGGSDTETAPEGEEEGKTRCICDFTHDDGYMICCDRCGEWQHVDCMGIDRNNIPDAYMCELCMPRSIDRRHARAIQLRKREELSALGATDSDSSDSDRLPGQRKKRLLTVTTYTNTSGSFVTTYNSSIPVLPPLPQPSLALPKRGPKRAKKTEIVRKVNKRKLTEKRVKRKKEMLLSRNKYGSNLSNQSHWQDSYELAVTNHYSPELRAKIMKYSSKLGNSPNMATAITAHLCTTVPHAGGKILIAIKELKENTPIIELRGKYMLFNQHRPQLQNTARAGSQKPGPFVFFYRLPKDNTQICIDTRTYGNEARFVRRSCKPNAELQHCIVKGTLHVYLVTTGVIQCNTEITVGHDTDGTKQPCACGNPKHCKVNGLNPLVSRKSVDYPPREKRSRNRCLSTSSPQSPPPEPPITPVKEFPPILPVIKTEKKSPIKHEYMPMSPVKEPITPFNYDRMLFPEVKTEIDLLSKEEMKNEIDEHKLDQTETSQSIVEEKSIEEAIKQEPEPVIEELPTKVEEPESIVKDEETLSEEEKQETMEEEIIKEEPKEDVKVEPKQEEEDRPVTREFTAKFACHDRSARTSRTCVNQDSLDDKTDDSQDKLQTIANKEKEKRKMTREERKMEAIMKAFERLEKAEQRKQEVKERQKRRESDPHPNATEKEEDEELPNSARKRRKRKGRARTTSQCTLSGTCRRRLDSVDSDLVTSGDEAQRSPPRVRPPRRHSALQPQPLAPQTTLNNQPEDLGLSSACLLVEAAVGSVESTFKLPKTKKTMATEWIGRSPERTPSPYRSPYRPSLVSAPSLESLVQVASTMIGDLSGVQEIDHDEENAHSSPPRTPGRDRNKPPKKAKRITRSTPPTEVTEVVSMLGAQHSAKKRWLRQAISEESDSPSAESPPNEMITPLKKRRVARESLSCEQNTIVPCIDETSPVLTSEDSPVKDDTHSAARQYKMRNIMDSIYGRDRTRSDSGQGSDDQCNMDNDILNVNIVPHDSENIRRIIGVPPTSEEYRIMPQITKPEDIKTNNNNVDIEDTNYNKVVPMEIDTTISLQPKLESNENSNSEVKGADSPNDKLHSCQSADTSGNSSPQRDEMDDIQKKIHSFHTENIQILKSRNKKPKEKRKKVNLNFDLNMVDDQISIQLRTENDNSKSSEVNGDIHDDMSNSVIDDKINVSLENIPLPPVETIPLPLPKNIPLPEEPSPMSLIPPPETIPLPEGPMKPVKAVPVGSPVDKQEEKSYSDMSNSVIDDKINVSLENIPLPPVETIPLPSPENTPLPEEPSPMSLIPPPEAIPLPEGPMKPVKAVPVGSPVDKQEEKSYSVIDRPSVLENSSLPYTTRFSSTGLFSGIFSNMSQSVNHDDQNVPSMSIIKSAIDKTTSLDSSIFDKESVTLVDEFKNVHEILNRVNSMDSNNSVILSGVLKNSNKGCAAPAKPAKPFARTNDPRLQPPPQDKPKPVRRKLSISEYRKRLKGGRPPLEESGSNSATEAGSGGEAGPEWSSESSGTTELSPQHLDVAAQQATLELEQRLHRELTDTQLLRGVFDAQPTASERQRENLSSRLRREFGLALPDDEEARPPNDQPDGAAAKRCDR